MQWGQPESMSPEAVLGRLCLVRCELGGEECLSLGDSSNLANPKYSVCIVDDQKDEVRRMPRWTSFS